MGTPSARRVRQAGGPAPAETGLLEHQPGGAGVSDGVFVIGSNGTSMAAPHVSSLAALLVEELGSRRPAQRANRIMQLADDLGEPGRDVVDGRGLINVPRALGL
jgi:subtilisin family serine protease